MLLALQLTPQQEVNNQTTQNGNNKALVGLCKDFSSPEYQGKSHMILQDMPLVGFGLWKVDKETTAEVVYEAIKVGYRLFDGAYDYQNEKEAGLGIKKAIDEGIVKREDIFVTTKLWNNYHEKYIPSMLDDSYIS